MTKVWIVLYARGYNCDDVDIVGVYNNEFAAQLHKDLSKDPGNHEVIEHEVSHE